MRYSTKQYAEALHELLEGANQEKQKEIVSLFAKTLFKHKRANQIKDITASYEDIVLRKKGLTKVKITAASEKDARFVAEKIGGKSILEINTDPSLVAGTEIIIGDQRVSSSFKSRLSNLKKAIS